MDYNNGPGILRRWFYLPGKGIFQGAEQHNPSVPDFCTGSFCRVMMVPAVYLD
jgi:hypothetical protein